MIRSRKVMRICALAAVCLVASAAMAHAEVLEYKFTPGQTLNYQITMNASGVTTTASAPPMQMTLQANLDAVKRTSQVFDDKSASVEMSCPKLSANLGLAGQAVTLRWEKGKVDITVNGQPQDASGVDLSQIPFLGQPFKMRVDRLGRVVDFKLPDLGPFQGMMGNMDVSQMMKASQNQLPNHPVEIGESWSEDTKVALPGSDQSLILKSVYTLVGLETIGGQEVAKIDMKGSSQGAGLKMAALPGASAAVIDALKQEVQGTIWFGTQLGQPVKNEMQMTMHQVISTPSAAGPQKTTMDMKMNLLMALK